MEESTYRHVQKSLRTIIDGKSAKPPSYQATIDSCLDILEKQGYRAFLTAVFRDPQRMSGTVTPRGQALIDLGNAEGTLRIYVFDPKHLKYGSLEPHFHRRMLEAILDQEKQPQISDPFAEVQALKQRLEAAFEAGQSNRHSLSQTGSAPATWEESTQGTKGNGRGERS